ncbi:MAG: N-acetyltransferase family protein [Candidatus Bathyarchaeia archaeon]
MKEGRFIRSFTAKDGRKVVLRAPRWSDLDDMLEFINSLVEEGADITMDRKQTKEEEMDWLARLLSSVEKERLVAVVAEVEGKFIGQVEVSPRSGRSRHVGNLGISVRNGYRDIGIGTELMKEAEAQARRLGIEIITLEVFATNDRARQVYEKVGYREIGQIPNGIFREGEYIDNIIMAKEISA